MEQSVVEKGGHALSLGPGLKDPAGELGFVKWHEFTAPADGQLPSNTLGRTFNSLLGVSRESDTDFRRRLRQDDVEQPFVVRADTRGDSIIDLDGLYIALRLGKMEEARGGLGMGKGTIGLLTELVNVQIEAQKES
jgi:hypothetical protein